MSIYKINLFQLFDISSITLFVFAEKSTYFFTLICAREKPFKIIKNLLSFFAKISKTILTKIKNMVKLYCNEKL